MDFKVITNKKDKRNKAQEEARQQQKQKLEQQQQKQQAAQTQHQPQGGPQAHHEQQKQISQQQQQARLSIKVPALSLGGVTPSTTLQTPSSSSSSYLPPSYSVHSTSGTPSSNFGLTNGRPPVVRTSSVSSHFSSYPTPAANLVTLRSCPVDHITDPQGASSPRPTPLLKICSENDRTNGAWLGRDSPGQSSTGGLVVAALSALQHPHQLHLQPHQLGHPNSPRADSPRITGTGNAMLPASYLAGAGSLGGQPPQQQEGRNATARCAEEALQGFAQYLAAEVHPVERPTADVAWGQTERERVYNFFIYVPYQLERLITFGTLLCLDSFLGVFTVLPLRCTIAVCLLSGRLLARTRSAVSSAASSLLAALSRMASPPTPATLSAAASSSSAAAASSSAAAAEHSNHPAAAARDALPISSPTSPTHKPSARHRHSSHKQHPKEQHQQRQEHQPQHDQHPQLNQQNHQQQQHHQQQQQQQHQHPQLNQQNHQHPQHHQQHDQHPQPNQQHTQQQQYVQLHHRHSTSHLEGKSSSAALGTPRSRSGSLPSSLLPPSQMSAPALGSQTLSAYVPWPFAPSPPPSPTKANGAAAGGAFSPSPTKAAASSAATSAATLAGAGADASAPAHQASGSSEVAQAPSACHPPLLQGPQLYDILCLLILLAATAMLRLVKPGLIYYWMKDITSEFLKLSVISAALEIAEKILGNFGIDVLKALSGTCGQLVAGKRASWHAATDAAVALMVVTLHALVLMSQALVVSVAMNSWHNGLLALLIANNFVEIKSTVFKRWDAQRLSALVFQDVVERCHLLVVMTFVVVEDMESSQSWRPSPSLLWDTGCILGAEVVIDIVKHAVLGNFNDIRPGIYREFMKEMADKAADAQSHSAPHFLKFHHLASAALMLRIVVTLFWLQADTPRDIAAHALLFATVWAGLMFVKPLLGYTLKVMAHSYKAYYTHKYTKTAGAKSSRSPPLDRPAVARPVVVSAGGVLHSKADVVSAGGVSHSKAELNC
ncbi:MAG: hypothetical protein WDW38_005035 [Sanguina aurantia]